MHGLLIGYQLTATAHPGMTNLAQQYLAIKVGKDDLLLISALGTPDALAAQQKIITAVFSGVTMK